MQLRTWCTSTLAAAATSPSGPGLASRLMQWQTGGEAASAQAIASLMPCPSSAWMFSSSAAGSLRSDCLQ